MMEHRRRRRPSRVQLKRAAAYILLAAPFTLLILCGLLHNHDLVSLLVELQWFYA